MQCERITLRWSWSRSSRGDADVGEQADAGIDGVDRFVAGGQVVDQRAGAVHAGDCVGREGTGGNWGARLRPNYQRRRTRRRWSGWRPVSRGTRLVAFLAGGDQLFDVDQLRRIVAGVAGVAVFVLLVVVHRFAQGVRERDSASESASTKRRISSTV